MTVNSVIAHAHGADPGFSNSGGAKDVGDVVHAALIPSAKREVTAGVKGPL